MYSGFSAGKARLAFRVLPLRRNNNNKPHKGANKSDFQYTKSGIPKHGDATAGQRAPDQPVRWKFPHVRGAVTRVPIDGRH
jgi:hypothetical protein